MSAVYLIRHAQASFGAEDYDALSPLGHQQATHLGHVLQERIEDVGAVFTGTLKRHRETAALCSEAMGLKLEPTALSGFDELDIDELLRLSDPRHADRLALAADVMASPAPNKGLQQFIDAAIVRWTGGEHDAGYAVPWPTFSRRCHEALEHVVTAAGRKNALVFTSGGPISALVAGLWRLPSSELFRVMAAVVNGSVTKIVAGSRGPFVSTFNEHSHFEGASRSMFTYR